MSTTQTTSLSLTSAAQVLTGYGSLQPALSILQTYTQGTGSNQVDQICFFDTVIVGSGTPLVLDLNAGSLVAVDGSPFSILHVKEILLINDSASISITVGAGSNPLVNWMGGTSPTQDLPPGGHIHRTNPLTGWAVTAGTADKITLTVASGTNVPIRGKITGTSI